MATYTGMFGLGLDDQEERMRVADERNRNYAMQLARMSPDEAVSYQGIRGVQQAADGLGGALRGMTGSPNANERMQAARQEIEARLRGQDMKDPLVAYPVIIEVLQKYGFVEEAMKAAKEYQELKIKADEQKRKTDKDAVSAEFIRAKASALKGNDFNEMVKAYQDIQEQLSSNPELSADQRMALQNMIRAYEVKLGIQRKADGTKFIPPSKYGKGGVFDPRTGVFTPVEGVEANRPDSKGSDSGFAGKGSELGKLEDGTVIYQDKNGNPYFFDEDGDKVPYNAREHGRYLPKETEGEARARGFGGKMEQASDDIDKMFEAGSVNATKFKLYFSLDGSPVKQTALLSTFSGPQKQFLAAVRQYLNATLRYESGAAVPESEYPKYMDPYIPFAGDSPAVVEQKRKYRQTNIGVVGRKSPQGPTPKPTNNAGKKPTVSNW